MKPYTCVESTVEFFVGMLQVRLWIDEGDLHEVQWMYKGILPKCEDLMFTVGATPRQLIEFIIREIPKTNAVQVIGREVDGVKQGIMVYTVDF